MKGSFNNNKAPKNINLRWKIEDNVYKVIE